MTKQFRKFEKARKFVHSLKLKDSKDWKNYYKSGNKPNDIPSDPRGVYKKEWKGMGDWLGTGVIASFNRTYKSFSDARKFVHSLKLKNGNDWKEFCKSGNKPNDIPNAPRSVYKKEWKNLSDWLGINFVSNANRVFLSFSDARKFVHTLKLNNRNEWREFTKSDNRPDNITAIPERVYKNDWNGMMDWLGTGRRGISNTFRDFDETKKFVLTLNLKGVEDWRKYTKTKDFPTDFPTTPETHYKNKGWNGYGDFLGTGNIATLEKDFLPYDNAKKIIRKWDFHKTQTGWNTYVRNNKIPSNIPKAPVGVYGSNFKSWGDWLGTGSLSSKEKSKQFLSYQDAKKIIQKWDFEKTQVGWQKHVQDNPIPSNIPIAPAIVYKKDFKSWGDWLGTGSISHKEKSKNWLPWEEAKPLYQKIAKENNFKMPEDWKRYTKTHSLPKNLPQNPERVYTEFRFTKGRNIKK